MVDSTGSMLRKPIDGVYLSMAELLSLQNIAKDYRLGPPRRALSVLGGSHRSSMRGRGMEFSDVRLYQAGDDIRTIDWRITARTQQTHTKLFEEEKERLSSELDELRKELENLSGADINLLTLTRGKHFFNINESPTEFYNRTVHINNPGVLSLDSIDSYVERNLTLPKPDFGVV